MPPNPVFSQIKAPGDNFALLKDFATHKNESEHHNKVLHEKIKLLTIQNRDLNITHLEGISYELKMNGEGGTGDMLGSNEGSSIGWETHQTVLEKAKRSAEAAH